MKLNTALAGLLAVIEGTAIAQADAQSVMQAVLGSSESSPLPSLSRRQPNFLFIITDDQDLELNSVAYTPLTTKHLRDKGTAFTNHFVTTSLCCPSRVSLWSGRLAHNTNVTDVSPPYGKTVAAPGRFCIRLIDPGGYPKFVERGFNDNFLPVWLQQAGYDTYYTGKLFNAHTVENYDSPHVNGFNGSDFLLDPYTYAYLNATFQRNHDPPVSYEGQHTTDVITEKALGFLNDALEGDRPWFVALAPISPHSNVDPTRLNGGEVTFSAPIPLERHRHLFEGVQVPRTEHFNPEEVGAWPFFFGVFHRSDFYQPSGVSWIQDLPKQNDSIVEYNDHFYRSRLRALQGVDELVDAAVTRLEESDQLDNTYIIYTSDNGFHIGQHRLPPGKTCGFEEDIRVPFFIRGPGVPEGLVQNAVTTHIDLAPTFFQLAGIPARDDFDGTPIPIGSSSKATRHEHVTVEYWGKGVAEGAFGGIGQ